MTKKSTLCGQNKTNKNDNTAHSGGRSQPMTEYSRDTDAGPAGEWGTCSQTTLVWGLLIDIRSASGLRLFYLPLFLLCLFHENQTDFAICWLFQAPVASSSLPLLGTPCKSFSRLIPLHCLLLAGPGLSHKGNFSPRAPGTWCCLLLISLLS